MIDFRWDMTSTTLQYKAFKFFALRSGWMTNYYTWEMLCLNTAHFPLTWTLKSYLKEHQYLLILCRFVHSKLYFYLGVFLMRYRNSIYIIIINVGVITLYNLYLCPSCMMSFINDVNIKLIQKLSIHLVIQVQELIISYNWLH